VGCSDKAKAEILFEMDEEVKSFDAKRAQ